MSLYREARSGRRRFWLAVGVALTLVAAAVVVVLTRGGEPSQAERLRSLQADVQPALAALELVPIHYESTNATTHAAASDQLDVARTKVADVENDLLALDAAATGALVGDLDALATLVRTTGRTDEVERAARDATARLRAIVRLD
jgi:hypothetical protein